MSRFREPIVKTAACLLIIIMTSWPADAADWMWSAGERHQPGDREFRRNFELAAPPSGEIKLRALGDFCGVKIELNGTIVARLEPYDPALEISVNKLLRVGENRIVVRAHGVNGPSAVALDIVGKDGERFIASGTGWEGGGAISPMGERQLGDSEVSAIGALDEYNQWKEAKGGEAQFSPLPEGFNLERLRSAKPDEDSWISMAFDPEGRLVIAKEKRGLLRLDLASGEMQLVEDTLLEVRGLLFAHGALYANANNSKGLYRLRDTDGDGRFEHVELLMKTEGGVGHGRNDLALGPDGMIYSIQGDSVKLPGEIVRRRPQFGTPGREQGYLIRVDADGKQRELLVTGLRNPYGIAFNPDGEAFTYDADNEGDIGLPLYRPARVNHLVSGANFGWQQADGESWPVYHPQSLPTTHDAGRGSPTAIEFGTKSNFPPRYRDALFILDWAYGRIIALDVVPHGASYVCRSHTFLRGRPLNVTDIAFGHDGALYFITGGRGTQSALYKVSYSGETVAPRELNAQEKARREYSKGSRELRRRLEEFHGSNGKQPTELALQHHSSDDPWIRHAAAVALADKRDDVFGIPKVQGSFPKTKFETLPRHKKLEYLSFFESPDQDHRALLESYFPDGDVAIDRALSTLLLRDANESFVEKSLTRIAATESQFERLHYLNLLSQAKTGWTLDGRRTFFAAIRHPDYFRGDSNLPGYLKAIRERAVATLSDDERAALGDLIQPARKDSPLPKPEPRSLVQHWTVADLIAAPPENYRRDPARGSKIFEQALCSRCHQIGATGTPVGPNLSAVAARFSRRDLVDAIIDPSKAMAEIFRPIIIRKKDGTTVAGRVVRDDFRESTIAISRNPFAPSDLTVISKKDIASSEPSPVSPMPPGLIDTFSREEILQLLDHLDSAQR
jgi:putative heme-binding domain-containing protein